MTINPNPTLFEPREASEPYSRGQWDSALKATPHSPKGDVSYVRALEPTARSGAHGFRSRRPRSLLTVLNYCRIRVYCSIRTVERRRQDNDSTCESCNLPESTPHRSRSTLVLVSRRLFYKAL